MKNLEVNILGLDLEEKEIIKKGLDEYKRGDFQSARNHFLSVYKQDNNPRGLQLAIAHCSLKVNKHRQARLFAFKEVLDYPDSKEAIALFNNEYIKVNGKIVHGEFNQTEWPETIPEISLVLIVKNEEKDLPRCLDSFKDIVKEIIVVDTGSSDRTVEIAKSFGARVEYFEWVDDFAAARNESLKYATCEWILRTDADEYIEDSEKPKLLHCANSGLADIYICPTVSTTKRGEETVENVRLIRNHLGITYEYPIHETVAINANRKKLVQCMAEIKFRHTGYEDLEQGSMEAKIKRNVKVCESFLEKNPDDYYVRLIRDLFISSGPERNKVITDIASVIQKLPEDALAVRYLGLGYLLLVPEFINNKMEIELLQVLNEIQIDYFCISSMMQYTGEIYYYVRGDYKKANKIFTWNLKNKTLSAVFNDVLPIKKYNLMQNHLLIADTYVLSKEYEKAKNFYSLAKKVKDNELAELKIDQINDFDVFYKFPESELREKAKGYIEKKEWMKAYKATLRAASKSKLEIQDYLDLATCQTQLGNIRLAQQLAAEAEKINPDNPMLKVLESMIAIKENNKEKALEKAIEAFVLEPGNPNHQKTVEQIANVMGMSPVEALKKTGLAWLKNGRTKYGLFALTIYLRFQPGDEEAKKTLQKYK